MSLANRAHLFDIEFDPDAVVVMASSVASRQAVENSLNYGASYYLRKDTKKEDVISIINRLIGEIWEGQAAE